MQKNNRLNIPNILSIFRLCMVPVFVLVYFMCAEGSSHYAALIVYAVAQGTDVADGYIARKYNMVTRLGRILDPLADKLMSFTVLVCLIISHKYLWWAAAIIFLKECLMGIGALVQYKRITDVPPANIFGKASTVYFYCLFIIILLLRNLQPTLLSVLFGIGVALTLIAFATYIFTFIKLTRTVAKSNAGKDEP